ncbi:hypothetical protein ISCGN_015256 [Ixodes scapularis]
MPRGGRLSSSESRWRAAVAQAASARGTSSGASTLPPPPRSATRTSLSSLAGAAMMSAGPAPGGGVTPLPPRYRFRDLILGDFAYGDDGTRYTAAYRNLGIWIYSDDHSQPRFDSRGRQATFFNDLATSTTDAHTNNYNNIDNNNNYNINNGRHFPTALSATRAIAHSLSHSTRMLLVAIVRWASSRDRSISGTLSSQLLFAAHFKVLRTDAQHDKQENATPVLRWSRPRRDAARPSPYNDGQLRHVQVQRARCSGKEA